MKLILEKLSKKQKKENMLKYLESKIIEILGPPSKSEVVQEEIKKTAKQILDVFKDVYVIPKTARLAVGRKTFTPEQMMKKLEVEFKVLEEIKKFEVVSGVGSYRKIKSWKKKLKGSSF